MADELKPCPFCGGEPVIVTGAPEVFIRCPYVECPTNMMVPHLDAAIENLIGAWNTRYERTCHLEQIPYAPGEYEGMRCSVCKTPDLDMGLGPYCAGCGAKVVGDEEGEAA